MKPDLTLRTTPYRMSRLGLVMGLATLILSACASHGPSPQSNHVYHAPGQAYSVDLGSAIFRGEVKLRESCTPEGSSLNIVDNEGRFFRIDAVNLINNPNIPLPEFADDPTVRELVLRFYTEKVNTGGKLLTQTSVNSRMGPALYSVVELPVQGKTSYLGYLIARRGNIAYVLQHLQSVYRAEQMRAALGSLAADTKIPGVRPNVEGQKDVPLYIDLKNSTPEQIAEWKKAADCT